MKKLFNILKKLFQQWNELLLLPLAFLLWKSSGWILHWIDPTSVAIDPALLMHLVYATIGTFVAHFVVSLMLRLSFPMVFQYLYGLAKYDIFGEPEVFNRPTLDQGKINKKLELRWKRLKYSFLLFAFYLLTFLAILATV